MKSFLTKATYQRSRDSHKNTNKNVSHNILGYCAFWVSYRAETESKNSVLLLSNPNFWESHDPCGRCRKRPAPLWGSPCTPTTTFVIPSWRHSTGFPANFAWEPNLHLASVSQPSPYVCLSRGSAARCRRILRSYLLFKRPTIVGGAKRSPRLEQTHRAFRLVLVWGKRWPAWSEHGTSRPNVRLGGASRDRVQRAEVRRGRAHWRTADTIQWTTDNMISPGGQN